MKKRNVTIKVIADEGPKWLPVSRRKFQALQQQYLKLYAYALASGGIPLNLLAESIEKLVHSDAIRVETARSERPTIGDEDQDGDDE